MSFIASDGHTYLHAVQPMHPSFVYSGMPLNLLCGICGLKGYGFVYGPLIRALSASMISLILGFFINETTIYGMIMNVNRSVEFIPPSAREIVAL